MGGHHHVEVPKVPDWRTYRVQDAPELLELQKALAQHGLRDPWLRNEVWKYTEGAVTGLGSKVCYLLFRGLKKGLIAGVITGALELTFFPTHHKYDEVHEGGHH